MEVDGFYDNFFGKTSPRVSEETPTKNVVQHKLPDLRIFHAIQENLLVRSTHAIKKPQTRQLIIESYIQSSIIHATRKTFGISTLKRLYDELARIVKLILTASRNIFEELSDSMIELLMASLNDRSYELSVETSFYHKLLDEIRTNSQHTLPAIRLLSKLDPHVLLDFAVKYFEKFDQNVLLCVVESIYPELTAQDETTLFWSLFEKCLKKYRHDCRVLLRMTRVLRAPNRDGSSILTTALAEKTFTVLANMQLDSIEYELEILEMNVMLLAHAKSQTRQILARMLAEFHQKPVLIKIKTVDLLIDKFFSSQQSDSIEVF